LDAFVKQQNVATSEISRNVASAADGTKRIVLRIPTNAASRSD
jgi:hypothetical protein